MKARVFSMVIVMVISLFAYAHAAECVPCPDDDAELSELDKSTIEMNKAVEDLGKKMAELESSMKTLPTTKTVNFDIKPKEIKIETIKEKNDYFSMPILIGLYVVCFIFGGIVFYKIGKTAGRESAIQEIQVSNSQQLWNAYLGSFKGGQTYGK